MSHDPRSSVRRGDPLAVSAEQINWINRQMRGGGGVAGALRMPPGLPQMTARLPIRGYFGQVARLVRIGGGSSSYLEDTEVGTPPTAPSTTWEYSEDESELPAFGRDLLGDTVTGGQWSSTVISLADAPAEPALAICIDNESHTWAVAGYAIARVRVFGRRHRYARMAMQFPGSTTEQDTEAAGCLDSAFYGPVKLLGYASPSDQIGTAFRFAADLQPPAWPGFLLRWALVKF